MATTGREDSVTFGRPSALRLDEGGLTLVEVLLAIAIVGVALAGLGVAIPVAIYGVQEGNQMSSATFLAEQMMERVRSSAWTAAPAVDCLGSPPATPHPSRSALRAAVPSSRRSRTRPTASAAIRSTSGRSGSRAAPSPPAPG